MTSYVVLSLRRGKPRQHWFFDNEERALEAACILIHGSVPGRDRVIRETLDRLWREGNYMEEIKTWNEGRFKYQFCVFQITVDSPSDSFRRFLEKAIGLPQHYSRKQEDGFRQPHRPS